MTRVRGPIVVVAVCGTALLAAAAACGDVAELLSDRCEVAFAPMATSLAVGDTTVARASAHCEGTTPQVRYTSSAPDVAAVDPRTGRIVAMRVGSATIVAQVVGAPAATATLSVSVACAPFVVAPNVTPASFTVVPGGRFRLTVAFVAARCASAADTTFVFTSSDTTRVTVERDGTVVARPSAAGAQGAITITSVGVPTVRLTVPFVVATTGPGMMLSVSPAALTIGTADTARIAWSTTLAPGTPATVPRGVSFAVSDSCVVRVLPDGLVIAGGEPGSVATITVAMLAYPTVSQTVGVTIAHTRGRAIAPHSITAGANAAPVDPAALRGTVTASLGVVRAFMPSTGRVELWLAGKLAGSAALSRPAPGETFTVIPIAVNTAARDSAGTPLYANGPQTLSFRVTVDGGGVFAGCPGPTAGQVATVALPVTLANP